MSEQVKAGTCWRHVDGFTDNTDFTRYNGQDVEWVMKDGLLGNPEWNWTLEEAVDAEGLGRWIRFTPTPDPRDAVVAAARKALADSEWYDPSRDGMDYKGPIPTWVTALRTALSALDRAGGGK